MKAGQLAWADTQFLRDSRPGLLGMFIRTGHSAVTGAAGPAGPNENRGACRGRPHYLLPYAQERHPLPKEVSLQNKPTASFQALQLAAAYIASHPRLDEVVRELDGNHGNIEAANSDSSKFLRGKGFEIPSWWTVKFSQGNSVSIKVCVNSHCVTVTIDVV